MAKPGSALGLAPGPGPDYRPTTNGVQWEHQVPFRTAHRRRCLPVKALFVTPSHDRSRREQKLSHRGRGAFLLAFVPSWNLIREDRPLSQSRAYALSRMVGVKLLPIPSEGLPVYQCSGPSMASKKKTRGARIRVFSVAQKNSTVVSSFFPETGNPECPFRSDPISGSRNPG